MRIVEIEYPTGNETIVFIENEDGSETSMPKAVYDELKANEAETI